jgi:hypothetical protein
MTNTTTKSPVGFIKMSTRRPLTPDEIKTRNLMTQSSWYDHGYEVFEVRGEMDMDRIKSALHKRFYVPSCGKFGGGTSIGQVSKFDDNHILVEFIYHIGD